MFSQSGDISSVYLCGACKEPVTWNNKGIMCELCELWFHIQCQNVHDTRGALDPDPAGYPVNFVDPVRIRIRPDPETVDPADIRIRPDPECLDPAGIRIWPDPKSPDPDPAGSYLNTTNTE